MDKTEVVGLVLLVLGLLIAIGAIPAAGISMQFGLPVGTVWVVAGTALTIYGSKRRHR